MIYVAQTKHGESPSLTVIGQWPDQDKTFLPVELDPELRAPSQHRRWYPMQDGSIFLGVSEQKALNQIKLGQIY